MNRRQFIGGLVATAALPRCWAIPQVGGSDRVYDYWCTWGVQNGMVASRAQRDASATAGDQGARGARENIDERLVFGPGGWADFFPSSRAGLYMMLDDGWDVAHGVHPNAQMEKFGSLEPAADRFGSFGDTPERRLAGINRSLRDRGWRGAGLWVAAQNFDERKLEASARAGIGYWKVDWGRQSGSNAYRRRISEAKRHIYPELIVEHMPLTSSVFNDWDPVKGTGSGRMPEVPDGAIVERMSFSDVIRIYDMLGPTETATALERIRYFSRAAELGENGTVLNVEDNPVLGAVLGHAFGLMRYPRPEARHSCTVGSLGIDEVNRALAWRRFAPVFGATATCPTVVSDVRIDASFVFRHGQGWHEGAWGRVVRQSAPAVMARGMKLPEVSCPDALRPFVVASRHPNGALALGVVPPLSQNEMKTPSASVRLDARLEKGMPLGVFGDVTSLTLTDGDPSAKVMARDLLSDADVDITRDAVRMNGMITLPGEALSRIGKKTGLDDPSCPGVLVRFV